MGGGDLNLKKSWHPLKLVNVEKVWKAEQKDKQEKERIAQLLREKENERQREELQAQALQAGQIRNKGTERLDWLYAVPGAHASNEEYLLGKKIERLPQEKEAEASDQHGPGALFSAAGNTTVDLAAKIREDPIFLIKKHQKEAITEVRRNPVKMAKLRAMLSDGKHGTEKEGKEIASSKRDRHTITAEKAEHRRSHRHREHKSERRERERERHLSRHSDAGHGAMEEKEMDSKRRKQERASPAEPHGTVQHRNSSRDVPRPKRRHMDESERQKRLAAMQADADWMDEQRLQRIAVATERERAEQKKEAEERERKRDHRSGFNGQHEAEFLEKANRAAVLSGDANRSLKDRLHRNRNYIQRTNARLDGNFMAK